MCACIVNMCMYINIYVCIYMYICIGVVNICKCTHACECVCVCVCVCALVYVVEKKLLTNIPKIVVPYLNQRSLTEAEGSIQLTSLY